MIVICTKCEAKFRVADDRVGPRGANVRCSRCRNVFFLYPPPPVDPAPAGEAAGEASRDNPFAMDPVRAPAAARPPPLPPPLPASGAPPPPPADPFAALAAPPAPDPFAAAEADPFAAAAPPPDPFAAAEAAAGAAEIPEADPADLLAVAAGGAGEPAEVTTGGLSLEDRRTPHPVAAAPAADPLDRALGPGAYDLGDEAPLALATEPTAAPGAPLAAAPAPAAAEPRPARAVADAPEPETRIPGGRGSRLRAAVVNAFALAALVTAALALVVVWRTDGPLDAASLRPAAILARLGGAGAAGPFSTRHVRSGLYERESGPPLLFVRGEIVSRAPAAVRGVKVTVEVVRDGRVLARGEALAGAVPTPEALHRAADAAALVAAAGEAASRAPPRIAPGDAVPFLVAIADHPADLDGASLRVEVAPAGDAP